LVFIAKNGLSLDKTLFMSVSLTLEVSTLTAIWSASLVPRHSAKQQVAEVLVPMCYASLLDAKARN